MINKEIYQAFLQCMKLVWLLSVDDTKLNNLDNISNASCGNKKFTIVIFCQTYIVILFIFFICPRTNGT